MPDATERPPYAAPRDAGSEEGRARLVALPRAWGRPRDNLPLQLTSFVGREREVVEVKGLLASGRLLTLTGPGGCGKTRLAIAAARDLLEGFEDGAWLVELASLSDPDLVPRAVASALSVREVPGRSLDEVVVQHLGTKDLLLVLDNCEHLVDACAALAYALLRSCPHLKILATSREVLGVGGEAAWAVPPLSIPEDRDVASPGDLLEHDAARLFAERARAVAPAFATTRRNAPVVARLCRRLEGMPLAIELAAARAKVLSVGQILEKLDDRFRLLKSDGRTAAPRHKTLRATMDWSHDLLADEERALFRRLSVFAGGFALEAAERICAGDRVERPDVLDLLSRLVDKSLVVVEERDDEARYRLLETVRQYGEEKLAACPEEATTTRQRHARYFLELAERAEPALLGPEHAAWMDRLKLEHDNLRAALGFLERSGRPASPGRTSGVPAADSADPGAAERGLRLAGALRRFWWSMAYYKEGKAWLEGFLELAKTAGRTAELAKGLHALGVLIHRNADYSAGDHATAHARLVESVEIYRELGDGPATASVLWDLGRLSNEAGDWETARSSLEESWRLEREAGNELGAALARSSLGFTALLGGEHEQARVHTEESLRVLRRLGSTVEAKRCLMFLGHLACDRGDHATARARFAEMMEDAVLEQNPWVAPFLLMAYAHLAAVEGQAARALRLAGAADALQRTVGTSMGPAYLAYLQRNLEQARRALGEAEGAAAREEGRAMTLEEAAAYALEEQTTPPGDTDRPPVIGAEERPGAYPDGLTAREAQVLGLLASGSTNRRIAAELFLSVSTVQRHVANVYAKIGAHGRAEATAYALRNEII